MLFRSAWQAFTIADNAAFYLSDPFSQARSGFRDKILSGQPEQAVRWKGAIHAVAGGECTGDRGDCFGNLGFGVGQLYVARYFPAASKAKIEALVGDIKAAMRARLERLDWMSPSTKSEALRKLDTYLVRLNCMPVMAKKPTTLVTSRIKVTTAPTPNCHSKRNQM